MSVSFHDGPAAGQLLALRRAPLALRVVETPRHKFDALDQLDDVAAPNERIHVYHRMGRAMRFHMRCSPRSASGWYCAALYRLFDEQPADADIRTREAWSKWSDARTEKFRVFDHFQAMRFIEQRCWCGVAPQLFTTGLFYGIDDLGHAGRFCYADAAEALFALTQWDGCGDPPGPWIKEKPGDRLGPGADGSREEP